MAHTRLLDGQEQRVLGALMEKEQATPDHYPLTLAAVVAACNQKSNRDPVLDLDEGEVRDALERLRKDVLVWRLQGPRSEKWQHCLTNRWHLSDPARALMTLLLLRGPQTPGELRSRSSRLHSFESVREVEATLERLAIGDDPLVRELARAPGQRESRWRHVMGSEADERVSAPQDRVEASISSSPETAPPQLGEAAEDSPLRRLELRVAELEARLGQLERDLGS